MHKRNGQGRLADAAHAQHAHEAIALLQHPPLKGGQFLLTAVEAGHIERLATGHPLPKNRPRYRQGRSTDGLERLSRQEGKRWMQCARQSAEPLLIQERLLAGCFCSSTGSS